jgi:hypothetical protein
VAHENVRRGEPGPRCAVSRPSAVLSQDRPETKNTEPVAPSFTTPTSFPPGLAASAYDPQERLQPRSAPCSVLRQPRTESSSRNLPPAKTASETRHRAAGRPRSLPKLLPAFTIPVLHFEHDKRVDEIAERRLTSWIEWYRFARRELDYAHGEAVVYANVRTVEDLNRGRQPDRQAA